MNAVSYIYSLTDPSPHSSIVEWQLSTFNSDFMHSAGFDLSSLAVVHSYFVSLIVDFSFFID